MRAPYVEILCSEVLRHSGAVCKLRSTTSPCLRMPWHHLCALSTHCWPERQRGRRNAEAAKHHCSMNRRFAGEQRPCLARYPRGKTARGIAIAPQQSLLAARCLSGARRGAFSRQGGLHFSSMRGSSRTPGRSRMIARSMGSWLCHSAVSYCRAAARARSIARRNPACVLCHSFVESNMRCASEDKREAVRCEARKGERARNVFFD